MSASSPFRFWRALFLYGGVALLLLFALALTAVRLVLPQAEQYRARVEAEASRYVGQPVRIARLGAHLSILSPTLVLNDVHLLDRTGRRTIAAASEIRVAVAPLASLMQWRPVLDEITLVGPSLTVVRRMDGSFRVQGLATHAEEQSDPEAVGRWILSQHHLLLRESHLVWREERSGRSFTFEGASVELHNDGERHQLDGRVRLPESLGGALRIDVDMEGDPLVAGGVQGEFYFAAQKVRPAGLLRLFPVEGVSPGGGELSAEMWGAWEAARLVSAQGHVQGSGLVFSSGARSETVSQIAGDFEWQRNERGWRLDVDDLQFARAGRKWNPSRLRIDLANGSEGDRAYTLQSTFLRLEDLAAVAALVPVHGEWQRKLALWNPRGDLREVRLEYGPRGAMRGGAAFTDLAVSATATTPGLSGFDGHGYFAEGHAGIHFDTRNAQLSLPNLFRAPLALKSLTGEVELLRDGAAWRVSSDGVAASNNDIQLRAAMMLLLPDRGAPFLDLNGDFRNGNAVTVPRYIPAHIMPKGAVAWLDRAFRKGRVVEGGMLIHGRLDQFPFDHGEGRFEVRFDAADVDLDYVAQWPPLSGIFGEVVFDGRSLRVEARQAQLFGSAISATTVAIPNLVDTTLQVSGHVEGELNRLFDYLRVTGLAGRFGDALAQFTAGGHYQLDLTFEKPLDDDSRPGTAGGTLLFEGSRLRVARGVELNDVRGTLRFNGDRYVSDTMTARIFGEPASFRVVPADGATRLLLKGAVTGEGLRRLFDIRQLARVSGRAPWEGQLLLPHDDGKDCLLRLRARLAAVAIDLPEPLGKRAGEGRDLNASAWFTGPRAREFEFAYGDRMTSAVALSPEGTLTRASLHFGSSLPRLPAEPGYLITGRLPRFSPELWAAVIAEGEEKRTVTLRDSQPLLPVRIDLDELGIVSAPESAGTVAPRSEPNLPVLNVRIGDLRYGTLSLGMVSFRSENQPKKVLFKEISISSPAFTVTGSAEWVRGVRPHTDLEARITGKDLGAAARQLAIASVFNKGSFDLQSRLAWGGAPDEFDLARLEGAVHVKLEDGTLTEVKPGAGRLLGLFSLQALPQRLTLDFRDLFDKGVRFRTVEGNFKFKDGDAFTDDLYMNALPAAVFVSGRTGLVKRDFDQTVTVVPDLSGSLPMAGLALGPQVGAAMFVVQQIFRKKIDDASKFKYTITGSWEAPVVEKVSKKR